MYSSFKDNIWGVDLDHTQLIRKYDKGVTYLLCAIYLICSANMLLLLFSKTKKGTTIANAFHIF